MKCQRRVPAGGSHVLLCKLGFSLNIIHFFSLFGGVTFFPALQFPWDVSWEPMPLFGQTPRKVFLHLISFYCSWAILLSFRPSDWLEGQVTT